MKTTVSCSPSEHAFFLNLSVLFGCRPYYSSICCGSFCFCWKKCIQWRQKGRSTTLVFSQSQCNGVKKKTKQKKITPRAFVSLNLCSHVFMYGHVFTNLKQLWCFLLMLVSVCVSLMQWGVHVSKLPSKIYCYPQPSRYYWSFMLVIFILIFWWHDIKHINCQEMNGGLCDISHLKRETLDQPLKTVKALIALQYHNFLSVNVGVTGTLDPWINYRMCYWLKCIQ